MLFGEFIFVDGAENLSGGSGLETQRAQYGLIKEHTVNNIDIDILRDIP